MFSTEARANIDHYLSILHSTDLTSQNRATISKLLVGEEDELSHDLEHLQFAEDKLAKSQDRMIYLSRLRDAFADGSADRAQAEKSAGEFRADS